MQQRIIALMAEGKSNKEIGAAVHLSPQTVKWHLSELYKELRHYIRVDTYGNGGRFQLLKFCIFIGLVKV